MQIGEVASFQNGYAFKSKDFVQDGKYKIIKIKELKDGKVRFFNDSASVNVDDERIIEKYIADKGDVLFALTGDPVNKNNPLSWVGRVSVYEDDQLALLNQRVCKLVPKEGINAKYIYYYFRAFDNFYALASIAKGSASQANISTKDIEAMEIALPSLNIQNKIVLVLDSIEEKINQNNKINNNLEQQAQALYQELFITNANPEWKTGTINDIGTVVGGSTPSKSKPEYYTEKGIAWITPKDLSVNKSKFVVRGENDITETGLKNSSASIMPEGTVLFSSRAPIGYIAIAAGEVTTNQGFKSVVPKPEIGTPFIYYFLKANLQVIEGMASGSTFKEVSGSTMKIVPAFIPDVETISRFNDFCIPLFAQQRVLEEQNKALSSIRDGLLPKLMSGELDVSDIDL
ncbi:restriction endonuclease subunit S [Catenibacterium sp. AM22-15]|uniref:restriction endonuclease subunit S n=1 Tax=unclassified Catenibacterium TaxID=2643636 RepID=UPI000E3F05A9|nr:MULTISPECIES: restriction endonuclease subunit S [unclassified Catenibacterium]RGE96091.1 restriction endonuclease subunit S [Catenibacterium sp. AM22-6LB]RGF03684.1 restriction endonuclease subunit S [Catenibacterium sp. AM22-15]